MSTLKGTTMHPRCRHVGACWDWMLISALQHKSKYKSNSISNFFEKKNQIFWFPCCSTREDLSIDVSITNVGLILTKLRWFQLFGTSQNSISNFFWFPWCSTREDLSIDALITNVGLTSTKPGRFLFSGYGHNKNSPISSFFEKNQHFKVSMLYYSWRPFYWCINY